MGSLAASPPADLWLEAFEGIPELAGCTPSRILVVGSRLGHPGLIDCTPSCPFVVGSLWGHPRAHRLHPLPAPRGWRPSGASSGSLIASLPVPLWSEASGGILLLPPCGWRLLEALSLPIAIAYCLLPIRIHGSRLALPTLIHGSRSLIHGSRLDQGWQTMDQGWQTNLDPWIKVGKPTLIHGSRLGTHP